MQFPGFKTAHFFLSYTTTKDNSVIFAIVLDWPEGDVLHLGVPKASGETHANMLGFGPLKVSVAPILHLRC